MTAAAGILPSDVIDSPQKTKEENPKVENKEMDAGEQSRSQTILRLKRRIDESPSRILLLSYKRLKVEDSRSLKDEHGESAASSSLSQQEEEDSCSQVLRLVGTVPKEEAENSNIITSTVQSALASAPSTSKTIVRKSIKARSTTKYGEKSRQQFNNSIAENRFRIVNIKRGVLNDKQPDLEKENMAESDKRDEDGSGQEKENDLLKLLDLVPETSEFSKSKRSRPEGFEPGNITCNGIPMEKECLDSSEDREKTKSSEFVYDLYMLNEPTVDDTLFGQLVSVQEADFDLDYAYGNFRECSEEGAGYLEDDDDSNSEDNWRNDYPDSENDGEEYAGYGNLDDIGVLMKQKFSKMRMNDDSSDEELIYGIDDDGADNFGFGMSFDEKYAKYKKRVQNELAGEVVSSASDSD